jgi:hypothetical protein
MDGMEGYFIVLGLLLAIVIFTLTGLSRRQRSREAWMLAARTMGIAYHRPRRIEGALPTGHVIVDAYLRRSNAATVPVTRYRARYLHPLGLGLQVQARDKPRLRAPGEMEMGDPEFDALAAVRGADHEKMASFLTPDRRGLIVEMIRSFPGLVIRDGDVRWEERGIQGDASRIVTTTRRLSRLSAVLSGVRAEEHPRAPVADACLAQTPVAGAPLVQEPVVQAPVEPWVTRPPVVEAPVPEAPAAIPAAPSEAPMTDIDAAVVCESLFGTGRSVVEADLAFRGKYHGRRVRWRGVLRAVREYSFDFVFENGPGTRAVLEVHELAGPFGATQVTAAVQLPPGCCDALAPRIGQPLVVEGRLKSADGLMHEVCIEDGRVVEPRGGATITAASR